MSAICGVVTEEGEAPPSVVAAMLAAAPYRGDTDDIAEMPGVTFGLRFFGGRPSTSQRVLRDGDRLSVVAGRLAPAVDDPAAELLRRIPTRTDLGTLDGAFAAAIWDGERLHLALDPFGVRSIFWTKHRGAFYFASELKQLLAIPDLPVELDLVAIHKYLTFSFVPGEDLPIRGIRRLLPRRVATLRNAELAVEPYFQLREEIDPKYEDRKVAIREIRTLVRDAVRRRLTGEPEVGLFLSGGIDSAAVALWLREAGANVRAFTLDFGPKSVEREEARLAAEKLGIPLQIVPADGAAIAAALPQLAWTLDLPYGDSVVGPQWLLGRAARAAGLSAVWNGEGGDQLFGGWTTKPMIASEVYGDLYDDEASREEQYLASYHRFYGLEDRLYTPDFRESVGPPGQRRAHLSPYLHTERAKTLLNRIRLADISLKGSQNILPRAERNAAGHGLDLRTPLFDRPLAEASFALPPALKLRGACEKYVLKAGLRRKLPAEIVWRRKYGMTVPVTDWMVGSAEPPEAPMKAVLDDLLGAESLRKRGLFRTEYVEQLRRGENDAHETRRRRIGERLHALLLLEAWMRVFVDGRGRRPS